MQDSVNLVSEFPPPPLYFILYKNGIQSGPAPPMPMSPNYHMFGIPYSTKVILIL